MRHDRGGRRASEEAQAVETGRGRREELWRKEGRRPRHSRKEDTRVPEAQKRSSHLGRFSSTGLAGGGSDMLVVLGLIERETSFQPELQDH